MTPPVLKKSQAWSQIHPCIIIHLEGVRLERLEKQRKRIVQRRMVLLMPLYQEYLSTLPHLSHVPGFPELCTEEPFRSLIFSTPIDTTLTPDDFAARKVNIAEACRAQSESQARLLEALLPPEYPSLDLAMALFKCQCHNNFKPSGDNAELYESALDHVPWDYRGSYSEAEYALLFRRPWNFGGSQVKYDEEAAGHAKAIIEVCGADPCIVSKKAMDELDIRVECLRCGHGKRGRTGRLAMAWSVAARKSLVGARGLAGNILVCKILGAFAHRGADLTRVKLLGDVVVHNLASVGVGLGHCHVPGRGPNLDSAVMIAEEECEIGLGLHNEPGVVRKKMDGPDKLVADMLGLIMRSRHGTGEDFVRVASGGTGRDLTDDIVLFINNLGGISQLELAAVLDEVLCQLASVGIIPKRVYSSAYMTSLNAPGFSISILNVSRIEQGLDASPNWNTSVTVLDLLDDPTDAVSWLGVRSWPVKRYNQGVKEASLPSNIAAPLLPVSPRATKQLRGLSERIERGIRFACETVLLRKEAITEFDTILGDGDCGETFAAGAKAILAILDEGSIDLSSIKGFELVKLIANALEDRMGGTIGALFAIFLTAVSTSLKDSGGAPTKQEWGNALIMGLNSLEKYTPAQPGDRTIVDALRPFCESISQEGNTLEQAVNAAKEGANSTRYMPAVLGRAAYVTIPSGLENLPPDPGAWGVVAILEGLCSGLHV
ncbi:hypothetical protein C0993_001194 [Termitomyces sp. T159_Od127]|nr:hypothetical protein C0993_001194 [Termitomyces sp. T159_Od127]